MKIRDLEKIIPYVAVPWWRPPATNISSNDKEAVEKWVSALLIQMRTQKIGLKDFLCNFRVLGFESPRCSM